LGLAFSSINTVTPDPQKTPVDNIIAQKSVKEQLFTAYLGSWRDADEADKGEVRLCTKTTPAQALTVE
jgi:hypothetical protein